MRQGTGFIAGWPRFDTTTLIANMNFIDTLSLNAFEFCPSLLPFLFLLCFRWVFQKSDE